MPAEELREIGRAIEDASDALIFELRGSLDDVKRFLRSR